MTGIQVSVTPTAKLTHKTLKSSLPSWGWSASGCGLPGGEQGRGRQGRADGPGGCAAPGGRLSTPPGSSDPVVGVRGEADGGHIQGAGRPRHVGYRRP